MKSSVHMYELDSFTYRAAAHDEGRVLLIPEQSLLPCEDNPGEQIAEV